MANLRLANVA